MAFCGVLLLLAVCCSVCTLTIIYKSGLPFSRLAKLRFSIVFVIGYTGIVWCCLGGSVWLLVLLALCCAVMLFRADQWQVLFMLSGCCSSGRSFRACCLAVLLSSGRSVRAVLSGVWLSGTRRIDLLTSNGTMCFP